MAIHSFRPLTPSGRFTSLNKREGLSKERPLRSLTARAVVVLDENNKVLHSELVPEIGQEPNYEAALAVLK